MSLKQDLIEQPSSSYFGWWTSRRLVRTAAKGLATRLGDNEGLGDAYRLHGIYYKKWGKYSESLDAYTSSLEIYKKHSKSVKFWWNSFTSLQFDSVKNYLQNKKKRYIWLSNAKRKPYSIELYAFWKTQKESNYLKDFMLTYR